MPILILKKCPFIRTALHALISQCWALKEVPSCWKTSVTVLVYKKGDSKEPSNFRPITLQPVFYKILSALYRNRMYSFLHDNNYIDVDIQKGFWPGCDGITEHTELLTHVLHDAKRHQRSISIALLDLKNAFGEINHRLIKASLEFHHLPPGVIQLFSNIYQNSSITVALGKERSKSIAVQRGVLQGDHCSPLLFNVCFNSLMMVIRQEK